MNTFNMKQWLTANKVGPYAKTALNESHEGNDMWIEKFHDALDTMRLDQWQKNQIHKIPSDQIISLYSDTTPERAVQDIVKKMFHAAREGAVVSEREKEVYENKEFEFEYNGKFYIADVELSLDEDDDLVVDVKSLQGTDGDEYEDIKDPKEYSNVVSYLQTDRKIQDKLMKYSPFSSAGLGLSEDEGSLSTPFKKSKNQYYEELFEEYEVMIGDQLYLADFKAHYDYSFYKGEVVIEDLELELLDVYKKVEGGYTEVKDPSEKQKVYSLLTSPEYLRKIEDKVDIPSSSGDEDPYDWDDYRDFDRPYEGKKNEQMGVGYVMKTKPSDPLDR
jgi:hypothetical protein